MSPAGKFSEDFWHLFFGARAPRPRPRNPGLRRLGLGQAWPFREPAIHFQARHRQKNFRPIFRRRPGRGPKRPQKVTGWTSRVSQFRQSKAICLLFRSLGGPCWRRRGPSWGRVWAILGDLGGVSMFLGAISGLRWAVSEAVAVVSKGFCGIVR